MSAQSEGVLDQAAAAESERIPVDVAALCVAFERMHEIRQFELRAEKLFAAGAIRGSTHLAIGQEACAVGARLGTRPGDLVAPTYRGHHYALAWGIPLDDAFGELLGRETGCNRGRGGSKHFSDAQRGVLPANAIVAAALPIACGTALRAKLDGLDQVTVVPFGDGATNQAVFHEALNQAAIWDLPVVFLCENNLYSEMTPIASMVKVDRLADRSAAYGVPGHRIDGMNVNAVAEAVSEAASRARAGRGPTFIEAMTYRFCGHMPGDSEPYRTKDEVKQWRERDPLVLTRHALADAGVTTAALDEIAETAERSVDAALAVAQTAPTPSIEELALGAPAWMEARR